MVPNSMLKEKGKQVDFQVDFTWKKSSIFLYLWMEKNPHILWYDLYLLLRLELQHHHAPTNVNCYHPGSWKALRKLNKGSKFCFVLHQNWSYCFLPFSLYVFLQFFVILSFGCLLSVHVASSQGMYYSSFKRMKMVQWVKFIYSH